MSSVFLSIISILSFITVFQSDNWWVHSRTLFLKYHMSASALRSVASTLLLCDKVSSVSFDRYQVHQKNKVSGCHCLCCLNSSKKNTHKKNEIEKILLYQDNCVESVWNWLFSIWYLEVQFSNPNWEMETPMCWQKLVYVSFLGVLRILMASLPSHPGLVNILLVFMGSLVGPTLYQTIHLCLALLAGMSMFCDLVHLLCSPRFERGLHWQWHGSMNMLANHKFASTAKSVP